MYDGHPACRVLEPFLVDGDMYDRNLEVTNVVLGALRIAITAQLGDVKLRRALGVPAYMDKIIDIDAQRDAVPLYGRFDGFVDSAGKLSSFIEFNGPWSGGVKKYSELNQLFVGEAAQEQLTGIAHVRPQSDPLDRFWQALRDDANAHRIPGNLRIGTPLPGKPGAPDAWLAHLANKGVTIIEAPVEEFNFDGKTLRAPGASIDYVAFVDLDPIMLGDERFHPIREALTTGCARSMQSISFTILAHSKGIFEIFSNPDYRYLFDEKTLTALDAVIPWTRVLNDRETTYRGAQVDLLTFVRKKREQLVIKPAVGDRGIGVILGWETDDEAWEKAIKMARRRTSVVQERVASPPRRTVTMFTGEKVHEAELTFDTNIFVWNMKHAEHLHIRANERGGKLNLAAGDGTIIPYFVVDPWHGE